MNSHVQAAVNTAFWASHLRENLGEINQGKLAAVHFDKMKTFARIHIWATNNIIEIKR